MAFPATLNPARPAGADAVNDPASTIDNQIRDLKQLLADLFGIPVDPTSLTAAAVSLTAGGLVSLAQPVVHRLTGQLTRTATDVASGGGTGEETFFTFSVPGGALGTVSAVRLTAVIIRAAAVTQTITWRLKYGGTTMATTTTITTAAPNDIDLVITGLVAAETATDAQRAILTMTGRNGANTGVLGDSGTAAIDSTVAQTLLLTQQGTVGDSNLTLQYAYLEYLP